MKKEAVTPVNPEPFPLKEPEKEPVKLLPEAWYPFRFSVFSFEPSPSNDPENDPDTPDANLRSTFPLSTLRDPDISTLPVIIPFHCEEAVTYSRLDPSP